MIKTIAVRGKAELIAIYGKYAEISGKQDISRPKATAEFIEFISNLPLTEETAEKLKIASKKKINVSGIRDDMIPTNIKLVLDVDEDEWNKAMEVFRFVFSLKGNPQMPYFIKVSGTAYLNEIEKEKVAIKSDNIDVDNVDLPEMAKLLTRLMLTDKDSQELKEIRNILINWRNNR